MGYIGLLEGFYKVYSTFYKAPINGSYPPENVLNPFQAGRCVEIHIGEAVGRPNAQGPWGLDVGVYVGASGF